MKFGKALIISEPWIDYILEGTKTWEMRSSGVSHRGWFGLIKKGTGTVHGVARLVDVRRRLSVEEMLAHVDKHRIPKEMILSGEVARWNTPWVLADVRRLPTPVAYRHANGAVTWVTLDSNVALEIERQLGDLAPQSPSSPAVKSEPAPAKAVTLAHQRHADSFISNQNGKLVGLVELTEGNIKNNHIYLRAIFDLFPKDAVGGSNKHQKAKREVSVDWGGPTPVMTDLDGSKRFFRARGWVRTFFERNDARPGDVVVVEETAPYAYRLRLSKGI